MLFIVLFASTAMSQETVFALFKNDLKLADRYFENRDYQSALKLYKSFAKKHPSTDVDLKIARSHHFLKQYHEAIAHMKSMLEQIHCQYRIYIIMPKLNRAYWTMKKRSNYTRPTLAGYPMINWSWKKYGVLITCNIYMKIRYTML